MRTLEIGAGDFDQHYISARQLPREVPSYEQHEDAEYMRISDPVWGECEIGDRPYDNVLLEIGLSSAARRTMAVEQLTLPRHFATMPNSSEFSRWEHIWGSVVFVRKMVEKAEAAGRQFDDRQVALWQLRTFVSDIGHTAFSHLGDWLFQGYGGSEDLHDDELYYLLEATGVNNTLRRYDIEPDEVIFPDIYDWIENDSPKLCVDRVDYGMREIQRWVKPNGWLNGAVDFFEIGDDLSEITVANQETAKEIALAFALLPTEHWGQPVHRLQLRLFGELVRNNILDDGTVAGSFGYEHHPRDLIYTIDDEINALTRMTGPLNGNFFTMMLDIARYQRRMFALGRESELQRWLQEATKAETNQFPEPLEHIYGERKNGRLEPQPVNTVFTSLEDNDQAPDFPGISFDLPGLKPRSIDPLFRRQRTTTRLSEVDGHFNSLVDQQRRIQARDYIGTILMRQEVADNFSESLHGLDQRWRDALTVERLAPDALAAVIQQGHTLSALAGRRFIDYSYAWNHPGIKSTVRS